MAHVLAKHLREAVLNNAIKGNLSNTLESDTKIENTISQLMANKKGYKWEKGKKKIEINPITDKDREAFSTRYALVRLGDIVSILGRIGFRGFVKEDFVEKSNFICLNPGNLLPVNKMSYSKLSYIREEKYAESPEIQIENGDILIVKTGSSYGKCAIIENLNVQATINPQLVRIVSHGVNKKYLLYVFASKVGKDQFEDFVTGTATPTFSQEKLSNFLVPFPPIEEQARIVARVDELMAKIDEYEKLENELVELKKNFPGDMKAAVLQAAMQGKLTQQLESDSNVFEYMRNVLSLKNELIKKKEIKKDKTINATDDETPFDIPDNWSWVKFGNIATLRPGKTPPRAEPVWWGKNDEVPWVSIADMVNNGTVTKTKEFISKDGFEQKFNSVISPAGTMIMSFKLTIGRMSILGMDALHNEAIISIFPFIDEDKTLQKYLFKVLPYLTQYGDSKNAIKGSTLNADSLCNLYIPLPPIEEQQRIVEKLDQLLPMCDELANLC